MHLSRLRSAFALLSLLALGSVSVLADPAPMPSARVAAPTDASDTEAKLAGALRSFTLVQKENDDLKAQVDKLTAAKAALEDQVAALKKRRGSYPHCSRCSPPRSPGSQTRQRRRGRARSFFTSRRPLTDPERDTTTLVTHPATLLRFLTPTPVPSGPTLSMCVVPPDADDACELNHGVCMCAERVAVASSPLRSECCIWRGRVRG